MISDKDLNKIAVEDLSITVYSFVTNSNKIEKANDGTDGGYTWVGDSSEVVNLMNVSKKN